MPHIKDFITGICCLTSPIIFMGLIIINKFHLLTGFYIYLTFLILSFFIIFLLKIENNNISNENIKKTVNI